VVDAARTLHLAVDNNDRFSRRFGNRRAALLRFFAAPPSDPASAASPGAPPRR
jgi:hypothetical protein